MSRFFSFRRCFDRLLGPSYRRPGKPQYVSIRVLSSKRCSRPGLEQLEDRLAPATTLSIADASALEPAPGGTVNRVFTATRTGDLTAPLTVGYTTVAGTAQPTTDFTPETGTTTFAAGSATATISIPIFGNGVYNNPNLTFSVQLTGLGPTTMFGTRQTFATGSGSGFVAVADVNGDGKPDLVTANFIGNSVLVLLNTTAPGATTPTFAAQQTFASGATPNSVAVADVNGVTVQDNMAVGVTGSPQYGGNGAGGGIFSAGGSVTLEGGTIVQKNEALGGSVNFAGVASGNGIGGGLYALGG
jgi:hypothetical protein